MQLIARKRLFVGGLLAAGLTIGTGHSVIPHMRCWHRTGLQKG
jgi:hypothetical protein